jgi:hypothetical protein
MILWHWEMIIAILSISFDDVHCHQVTKMTMEHVV